MLARAMRLAPLSHLLPRLCREPLQPEPPQYVGAQDYTLMSKQQAQC